MTKRTKSGSPIIRHNEVNKNREVHYGDNDQLIRLDVEKHIGKITYVLHEIMFEVIHQDVLYVEPSEHLPYHFFITCGMSDFLITTGQYRC